MKKIIFLLIIFLLSCTPKTYLYVRGSYKEDNKYYVIGNIDGKENQKREVSKSVYLKYGKNGAKIRVKK